MTYIYKVIFSRAKNAKKNILTSRNLFFFKFEHFHKYDITIVHMKLWDCGFSIKTISYLIFIYHFQGYSFNPIMI